MKGSDGSSLPTSLELERLDDVAVLRLARATKRNALNDDTVRGLEAFFGAPSDFSPSPASGAQLVPADSLPPVRAVVLDASGSHFCAGLDLSEMAERSVLEGIEHSMMWHRAFERIEFGAVPVISVLKGAVIGGGLELACATHLRVAEDSAFYALPEGQHALFVGGGGSVRIPRLIGAHRMIDMMLTGRVHDADTGQQLGLSQYRAAAGGGLELALELARKVAALAPVTTFAVLQVLPRITNANPAEGYLMEALMAAVASGGAEAKERMAAFLAGRAGGVNRPRSGLR